MNEYEINTQNDEFIELNKNNFMVSFGFGSEKDLQYF